MRLEDWLTNPATGLLVTNIALYLMNRCTRTKLTDERIRNDRQDVLLKRLRKQVDTIQPDWRDDAALTDVWDPEDDRREILQASERIPRKGADRRWFSRRD